jgi:cytidylate kinase
MEAIRLFDASFRAVPVVSDSRTHGTSRFGASPVAALAMVGRVPFSSCPPSEPKFLECSRATLFDSRHVSREAGCRMAYSEASLTSETPVIGRFRTWPMSLARWLLGKRSRPLEPPSAPEPVARFRVVCIGREAGAGGGTIARMVGTRLGWKVYDHEIVDAIAQRMEVDIDVVRALDELAPGLVQDWLLPLREEHYAPQEAYLDHLAKLIEAIGHAGDSVIVGRGANFMLPREEILAVRVIAPLKIRAQRLAEKMGLSYRTARRAAYDLDNRRYKFVRTMHRANVSDPRHYDLVLDTASLGLSIASELIVRAVELGLPPIEGKESAGLVVSPVEASLPPPRDETSAADESRPVDAT